jgi:hypothetical protein
MSRMICRLLAAAAFALPALAAASFHTFRIEEIFSNADGSLQYVVLHEAGGLSGQQFLDGHTFTSAHAGIVRTFTFPTNLPSGSTGGRSALLATQRFATLSLVTPDYVIPDGFLPTDGGTINYAGVDQVTFGPLPTDGTTAIDRNGATVAASPTNFSGTTAAVPPLPVTAVEFYWPATDHYFISAQQPEIAALDSGRFPGWVRTGLGIPVYATVTGNAGANPVCRIYIPPPGDSHFFSASPAECTGTITRFPTLELESTSVFAIGLPDANGACAAGTIPVYRVFDNRPDPNHRYTTDRAVRDAMVAKGYLAEGAGPDTVTMCAPAPVGPAASAGYMPPPA